MHNGTGHPLAQISRSGLLQTSRGHCGVWSSWHLEKCRCRLEVKYGASQSLAIDLVVKPPVYILARDLPPGNAHWLAPTKVSGLPFGGPYEIALSFHDEIGDIFDAVTGKPLSYFKQLRTFYVNFNCTSQVRAKICTVLSFSNSTSSYAVAHNCYSPYVRKIRC